jgi:ubiquinone/menaquinone biosynthesis C-methylase UbiE
MHESDEGEGLASAESFDAVFAAVAHSQTLRAISRDVYGADYPEEADPFSFVTLTDLRRIAHELSIGQGQRFADVACGSGGPGIWVARCTGAALIGIDSSTVAIAQARARAHDGEVSEFRVADAANTGLPPAAVDAVMSIDAFWLFPDKECAAAEIARILRPGGRLVFTTWDFDVTLEDMPPQLAQHHDLLRRAGLDVEIYEETPDWRARQLAVYTGWLAAEETLVAELGQEVTADLIAEAREFPPIADHSRRVLIAARRTGEHT